MILRLLLSITLITFSFSALAAKPTDKDIIKQISRPNMSEIKLSKTGGSYSTYNLQHWWTRGVTYKINAGLKEFPDAKIKIGAEARYRIVGENYDFDKLKTVWNEYEGIPMPQDSEILNILKNDIVSFVQPYNWNQMISKPEGPILSSDPAIRKTQWHSANSFSIHVQAKFSVISSYTEVQDKWTDFTVRFYRDDIKQPWKPHFISSKTKEKILATHKYSTDEINAMPTQASLAKEKKAQAATSTLPRISIPEFNSDKEAFAFIYNILRTGNKQTVEALLRAMISPDYYLAESTVQLSNRGKQLLNKVLNKVFDGKATFAESYCPQIFIQKYQKNQIYIVDALKKNKSRIAVSLKGGHFERGKKVGQKYKITALDVWTLRTNNDVAQLKSWPFNELCADTARTFQQLQIADNKTKNMPQAQTTAHTAQAETKTVAQARIIPPANTWAWTIFKSKYLPVSMKIIGTATEKQKMTNGKLSTAMVAQSNAGTFRMIATDYKQKITPAIANPTHIKFARNFVKSNKALIHKKQVIKFATGDAQQYLIERGSGAQKFMIHFRIFSHGTVVYQVAYSQPKKTFDKARSQEFMNSILIQ